MLELIQVSVSAFFLYIYILARVHNTKTFLYYELLILERKTSALMKNYPVVGRAGYQKTKKYLPSVAVTAGFWPLYDCQNTNTHVSAWHRLMLCSLGPACAAKE